MNSFLKYIGTKIFISLLVGFFAFPFILALVASLNWELNASNMAGLQLATYLCVFGYEMLFSMPYKEWKEKNDKKDNCKNSN